MNTWLDGPRMGFSSTGQEDEKGKLSQAQTLPLTTLGS